MNRRKRFFNYMPKKCLCGCGEIIIWQKHHKWRDIKYIRGHAPNKNRLQLVSKKFGRLTVIKFAEFRRGKNNMKRSYWKCKCACGNYTVVRGLNLKIKNGVKSCGCLQKEVMSKIGKRAYKHGMSNTKFFRIWVGMQTRCFDSKEKAYRWYGARGITVCKRWLRFENFRDDMYKLYLKHKKNNDYTSIERINSNGNYKPSNCKWATREEQRANQRPRQRTRDFR